MRSGKINIKRYKTGRNKTGLLVLLPVMLLGLCLWYFQKDGGLSLPSFLKPALSREDMQQESRQITLPGGRYFALQLGVFSDLQSARALAESFRSRGAAGYIWEEENYRVLAAAYESRENALAVQQNLADRHGVDAYLYTLSRSQLTLKLTGQKAQLDALSDACGLCVQLADALAALSQSLDAGATGREEALEALASQQATLRSLNARLSALFAREEHPAVTRLCALMTETEENLAAALEAPGETRLGSGIKYCQLALLCGLEGYAAALIP